MNQLFDDLEMLEAAEQHRLSGPLDFRKQPRELLIQLFGKPADVKSADRPTLEVASITERARFIASLTHDSSRKIGDAVKTQFLESPDDEYLAAACLRCLANRGYAQLLVEQLNKIDIASSESDRRQIQFIEAIASSRDQTVRNRLLDILQHTSNEGYFMAALPGVETNQEDVVLSSARRLLAGLPEDTDKGLFLLTMVSDRFPDEAKTIFQSFLVPGTLSRAKSVCYALSRGNPLARELLVPLLNDKRLSKGNAEPMRYPLLAYPDPIRICDLAAQGICNSIKTIKFDSDWRTSRRDEVIEQVEPHFQIGRRARRSASLFVPGATARPGGAPR